MPVPHLLLGILAIVPESHGYAVRELADLASWSFPVTNPRIYPIFADLERKGWVKSRSEVKSGRHRKLYSITEAGRAELHRWIEDPKALPSGKGAWRDPMLYRIRMLDAGGLRGATEWIREGIAYFESYIQGVEEGQLWDRLSERNSTAGKLKYLALSRAFGVEQARLRIRFYRQVLDEIERDLAEGDA